MGASFDFEIVGIEDQRAGTIPLTLQELFLQHGPGILEIKNVDRAVFASDWLKVDEENEGSKFIEPPGHIDIQLQHQLHVRDRSSGARSACWSAATLASSSRACTTRRSGRGLERRIIDFWMSVANDQSAAPTFPTTPSSSPRSTRRQSIASTTVAATRNSTRRSPTTATPPRARSSPKRTRRSLKRSGCRSSATPRAATPTAIRSARGPSPGSTFSVTPRTVSRFQA
jgi:hypothetical protein